MCSCLIQFLPSPPSLPHEDDSPYPEVRSAVANFDDSTMPASTLRAWVLGIAWAIVIPGMNQFFYFRYPSVSIGGVSPWLLFSSSWSYDTQLTLVLPFTQHRTRITARRAAHRLPHRTRVGPFRTPPQDSRCLPQPRPILYQGTRWCLDILIPSFFFRLGGDGTLTCHFFFTPPHFPFSLFGMWRKKGPSYHYGNGWRTECICDGYSCRAEGVL